MDMDGNNCNHDILDRKEEEKQEEEKQEQEQEKQEHIVKPLIEHLVISGGGPVFGLYAYGVLKKLNEDKIFHIKNIKSIYGCSAGSILGAIISLNYDWDDLSDYIIGKPWDKIVNINPEDFLNINQDKGILDRHFFEEIFNTLLLAKDLSVDITLKEYYEYNNIDLHIFTVKVNTFEYIDISHHTHPNIKLIDAIYMSSAIPFIFKPVIHEECNYIDGALIRNFPFDDFKQKYIDVSDDNIICINMQHIQKEISCFDMSLVDYASFIYRNQLMILDKQNYHCKYKITIPLYYWEVFNFATIFKNSAMREEIINKKSQELLESFLIDNKLQV